MAIIRSIVIIISSFVTIIYGANAGLDTNKYDISNDKKITQKTTIEPEDPTGLFLISTDFALPISGYFTLTMERTIARSKTLGIIGIVKDKPGGYGIDFFAIYLNLNIYSKKAFKGWWIAPNIGFKNYIYESMRITANLNGGYKWELPCGFSIGIGFGPGISGSITKQETDKILKFDFVGGAYFGKAFGTYKK